MDWLDNSQWLIWVAAAIAAGVAEVATLNLIFVMIAGGALAAALAAFVAGSVTISVVVFAISTVLLLFGARPPLLHYMRQSLPSAPTNVAALVGRDAEVLSEVTEISGTVRLSGETWTARTEPGEPSLEVGSSARVVRIDGATAMVAALADGRPHQT